jgi:putative PEP-CTERM system histidine kinase
VRRGSDWILRLKVSRVAAFYSVTLVLAGAYLLFIATLGYYVRYFGGGWGQALQLGLVIVAMAALGVLVVSGALRSRLRVFVGKHFFAYRYDYRDEWLRFTAMLSSQRSPQEMGGLIVRGMAKMVECPAGSLWSNHHAHSTYTQVAHWNMPQVSAIETPASPMCSFLREKGWVVDLEEYRNSPRRYGALSLPSWLLGTDNAWLLVPLLVGEDLLGFVVLARPRSRLSSWIGKCGTCSRLPAGKLPATWPRCMPLKHCWKRANSTPSIACRPSLCMISRTSSPSFR